MHWEIYAPRYWATAILLFLLTACNGSGRPSEPSPKTEAQRGELRTLFGPPVQYRYEVLQSFPHDPGAWTQGLVYDNGRLLESTGLNGQSSLREVELSTGRVVRKVQLPSEYFAEGLALMRGRAFQLTWQSQKGFIYDLSSFQRLGEFSYSGEGWGLATDGRSLIMSDGSPVLRYLDPAAFNIQRAVLVLDGDRPVRNLNELEYIDGEIYANVWMTDRIVCIDPGTGFVRGWIDLSGLLRPEDRTGREDVLNGIAYDADGKRLFVTGKLWSKLFQIRRVPR